MVTDELEKSPWRWVRENLERYGVQDETNIYINIAGQQKCYPIDDIGVVNDKGDIVFYCSPLLPTTTFKKLEEEK